MCGLALKFMVIEKMIYFIISVTDQFHNKVNYIVFVSIIPITGVADSYKTLSTINTGCFMALCTQLQNK